MSDRLLVAVVASRAGSDGVLGIALSDVQAASESAEIASAEINAHERPFSMLHHPKGVERRYPMLGVAANGTRVCIDACASMRSDGARFTPCTRRRLRQRRIIRPFGQHFRDETLPLGDSLDFYKKGLELVAERANVGLGCKAFIGLGDTAAESGASSEPCAQPCANQCTDRPGDERHAAGNREEQYVVIAQRSEEHLW